MRDFRKLKVWSKAHLLALTIYRISAQFPKEEVYGLTRQLRRAGASIPANVAEGCGRTSKAELCRFLQIAMGSASELEYHLLLARDLRFLAHDSHESLATAAAEIKKMLTSLMQKLKPDC
jgi:four helix bundle protein